MTENTAYQKLTQHYAEIFLLKDTQGMLGWDAKTMMPKRGASSRGRQMTLLSKIIHQKETSQDLPQLLLAAEQAGGLSGIEHANLREMKRLWIHANAVPEELVTQYAEASFHCETAWEEARPRNDFAAILPHLQKVVDLARKIGEEKAKSLGCTPYEALMDEYEPGLRCDKLDHIFGDLSSFLPDFLSKVQTRQNQMPPALPLTGPFPVEQQYQLGLQAMKLLGFDFDRGRLDVSAHPFCGGTASDVRITTRYNVDNWIPALFGVVHETGHALYEQGLPEDHLDQPVGKARGMATHEGQSLFQEMQMARSQEFVTFMAPAIRQAFNGQGPAWEPQNLYRHITAVKPGLIRVDADEVTYPLHVILRYQIEKDIIEGRMELKDLPTVWNQKMQTMLGITPPDDKDGCMQDVHWFCGAWGYFPTYTLGAMTAAQLFTAAQKTEASPTKALEKGDLSPVLAWLRSNVHEKASQFSADEILIQATGSPLTTEAFKNHLAKRYLPDNNEQTKPNIQIISQQDKGK